MGGLVSSNKPVVPACLTLVECITIVRRFTRMPTDQCTIVAEYYGETNWPILFDLCTAAPREWFPGEPLPDAGTHSISESKLEVYLKYPVSTQLVLTTLHPLHKTVREWLIVIRMSDATHRFPECSSVRCRRHKNIYFNNCVERAPVGLSFGIQQGANAVVYHHIGYFGDCGTVACWTDPFTGRWYWQIRSYGQIPKQPSSSLVGLVPSQRGRTDSVEPRIYPTQISCGEPSFFSIGIEMGCVPCHILVR